MGLISLDTTNHNQVTSIMNHQLNVISRTKLVIIDFWAPWCQPCKNLSPIIEKLSNELFNVEFIKVNVDDVGDLSMGVQTLPTVIFFQNGKMVDRKTGFMSEQTLRAAIKNLL